MKFTLWIVNNIIEGRSKKWNYWEIDRYYTHERVEIWLYFKYRKEKEKKDRILSNKNNDLVRELANKIVAGDKKETTEKKQNKIINVGAKLQKKSISNDKPKTAVKTSAPLKKTKGMLTFEQESDSD